VKIALISDIHGNLEALETVIADALSQGIDAFACLGDIVGYGADPVACLERIRGLDPIAIIKGNHDAYSAEDLELSSFNPIAREAAYWTRDQLGAERRTWLRDLPLTAQISSDILLVHATPLEPESWNYVRFIDEGAQALDEQMVRLCCYGHTHMAMAFRLLGSEVELLASSEYDLTTGDRWLVNVGSVGQPRDGDWRAAWTMLDTEADRLTLRRLEYDVGACQEKILAAGLPERLATRLAEGR